MVEVPLTQGKVALIDDEDAERVIRYKWHARWDAKGRRYYAVRQTQRKRKPYALSMHRFILNAPPDAQVDHINRDGLDNRRSNLRLATANQNHWNSGRQINYRTGFKGVYWSKKDKRFRAAIKRYGAVRGIGSFGTAIEAARVYDAAARLLFGEFARLNFPNEVHQLDPQVAERLVSRDSQRWTPRRSGGILKGAANGRAMLTSEQAKAIREDHANGDESKQLAAKYNVSRSTIYRIVKCETYNQ
jgi:hypothetical protein